MAMKRTNKKQNLKTREMARLSRRLKASKPVDIRDLKKVAVPAARKVDIRAAKPAPVEVKLAYALGRRADFAAPVMFLQRPAWRGQIDTRTLTPESAAAMRWTEKSGAYKFYKRNAAKLPGFRVVKIGGTAR